MIKAVLFDKDGTLIDFKSIWLPVTKQIVSKMSETYGCKVKKQELLKVIGVEGDTILGTGILAAKTVVDVANAWHSLLLAPPDVHTFTHELSALFYKEVKDHIHYVEMFPQTIEVLGDLKKRGLRLGVVTADSKETTLMMLHHLNIIDFFDYIGAEDGVTPPKPDRAHMDTFCAMVNLNPSEVVMVGDTLCDMNFGRNTGAISVGVLSGTGKEDELKEQADYVIPSIASLRDEILWEI